MEKEKLKIAYDAVCLEVIKFGTCDIVTTSGETASGFGDWVEDKNGWS